jgi:hypothetical protein
VIPTASATPATICAFVNAFAIDTLLSEHFGAGPCGTASMVSNIGGFPANCKPFLEFWAFRTAVRARTLPGRGRRGIKDSHPREETPMKKTALGLLILGADLAAAGRAQESKSDITGVWEVSFETPMGARTYTAAFVQDKDSLKVTMKSSQGTEMKGEGTIKGNEAAWSVVVSGPMGEIVLAFKGRIDGEAMSGTVAMGDAGETDFKAKRMPK